MPQISIAGWGIEHNNSYKDSIRSNSMGVIGYLVDGKNLERKISEMQPGESGFTIPWALGFDRDKNAFLDTDAPVRNDTADEHELRIDRVGPGKADYNVYIRGSKHKWALEEYPLDGALESGCESVVQLDKGEGSEAILQKKYGPSVVAFKRRR